MKKYPKPRLFAVGLALTAAFTLHAQSDLTDPTLIPGTSAIDPPDAISKNVSFSAAGATSATTLEALTGFAAVQSFAGIAGNVDPATPHHLIFTSSTVPDVRLTYGDEPAAGTVVLANSSYATSGTSAATVGPLRIGLAGSLKTSTLRIEFGSYDTGTATFSADRAVQAVGFTVTGHFRRTVGISVSYYSPHGDLLSAQLVTDPSNPPTTTADSTITAGYTGFEAPSGESIAWIQITVTGNGNASGAPVFGLDDLGFTPALSRPTPPSSWESTLFDSGWTPWPSLEFASDAFLQDFSYAGYHRGEDALPTLPGATIYNAVSTYGADPTGSVDSTSAIQNAINDAAGAGGGVVYLPPGTYRISVPSTQSAALRIFNSNVVLRGAGSDRTFLLNTTTVMRGKQIILVYGPTSAAWDATPTTSASIAADLLRPTNVIPLDDVAGFSVGDTVVIRCDLTDDWLTEHNEPDWVSYDSDLGSILYLREITAIDPIANEIVVDIPIRYFLKTRDHPIVDLNAGLLSEVGIEHLSIGNVQHPGTSGWGTNDFAVSGTSAYDVHYSFAINIQRTRDSWVNDVGTFVPSGNTTGARLLSNGLRLFQCRGVTVSDCDFQLAQYGGGGGNGYMYRLDACNECLIEDSSAGFARHGFSIAYPASSGNVLHDCLDHDTGHQTGSTGSETTGGKSSDHHMYFSHSNLIDRCTVEDSWFEARYRNYDDMSVPKHNLTGALTVFWNTTGDSSSGFDYAVWSQQGRLGYVVGTRGNTPDVKIDGVRPDHTDPVDHVEGVGFGATLSPSSLFDEQRWLRLGIPVP